MNPAPIPSEPQAAALDFARRLDAILAPLGVFIFARMRFIGPWAIPIMTRLTRARRRLAHLFARIAAGTPAPKPRPTLPRPTPPHLENAAKSPPPLRLPAKKGWLLSLLRHEAAFYTVNCETLLASPENQQFLAANPAIMRSLRPFLRLLAVQLPPALQPKPRAPKPAPPKAPRARPFSLYPHPPRSPWGIPRSIVIPTLARKFKPT